MKIAMLPALAVLLLDCAAAGQVSSGKTVGTAVSPVMIEVFSDFQCPACKSLHEETIRPLVDEYAKAGKVYLIYRNFPLAMHSYARQAAIWACAAGRLGKYGPVADTLFRTQASWSISGKIDSVVAGVVSPAEMAKLNVLVKDPAIAKEVQADVELGQRTKIQQTPTIIITHRLKQYPLSGFVNWAILRRFIDDLLKK
jgi:protein-disulfide isomerase